MASQLILASKNGDIETVRNLLDQGVDPNSTEKPNKSLFALSILTETTPLIEASKNGHIEIVRLLLKNGADPQKTTTISNPPIIFACKNNHEEIVKLLLDIGVNPKSTDINGIPLIGLASSRGHLDVVRTLVETNGVDIEKRSSTTYNTPLMYAIESSQKNVVEYLLEHGASVKRITNGNNIPLTMAADQNDFDIFKMVFDASQRARINLKHKNNSGFDVLTIAALHMNADYIEYLFLNNVYDIENYEEEVKETKEIIARYKPDDLEFQNKRYKLLDRIANNILLPRATTGFLSLKSKGMPVDLVRHTMSFYRSKNSSKKGGRTKKHGSKKRGSKKHGSKHKK